MYAKICKGNRVELYLSERDCQRGTKPLATSSGTQIKVKDRSLPKSSVANRYVITVLFTYGEGVDEVTIITMEASVSNYTAEEGVAVQEIDNRAYYLRQEIAEQKCREGFEVGFINTWNNDCYYLELQEDGKIKYRKVN